VSGARRDRARRRGAALAAAALAAWTAAPSAALGDGRPPSAVSVARRDGRPEVLLGTTFGVLLSRDDGCSFRWLCEQSLGYGGGFDPKLAVGPDGSLYVATFEGLRISRDGGCTFTTATAGVPAGQPGALSGIWIDAIDVAANGDVWVATADSGSPNDVYRSRDQGRTFAPMGLRSTAIWWKSVKAASQDPHRIYATGYQVAGRAADGSALPPTAHVRRSDDGGATWIAGSLRGVALATTPVVHVMAVDRDDADVVFLRSAGAAPPSGDRLYRSFDGGASFREVATARDGVFGVVKRGTQVLVAVGAEGALESHDGGVTFQPIVDAPRLRCLADRGDGSLLGCGANWQPDFFALGRSSDGHQWRRVTHFADLAGAVSCPDGTVQHDTCEAALWPALREQFGARGASTCPAPPPVAMPRPDAAPAQGSAAAPAPAGRAGSRSRGCCDGGSGAAGWLAGVLALLLRRRGRAARPR
jgi:hypothetical protein